MLVAPEQYEIPGVSPLWTTMAYAAFDESKLAADVSIILENLHWN